MLAASSLLLITGIMGGSIAMYPTIKKSIKTSNSQYRVNNMYRLVRDFNKYMRKNHIEYFCICGTLLGAVRNKGLIPWDNDFDVGIMKKDLDKFKRLRNQLKDTPYDILYDDYIWRFKDIRTGIYVDVFLFDKHNNKYTYTRKKNLSRFPNEYFKVGELYPLKKYSFGPLKLLGPSNCKSYLKRAFGDWKVSQMDCNWYENVAGPPVRFISESIGRSKSSKLNKKGGAVPTKNYPQFDS